MKFAPFVFTVFLIFNAAIAQDKISDRVFTEGFYINLGMTEGPEFNEFFDYVNDTYGDLFLNTSDKIGPFKRGFNAGGGYFTRFYPNFALDVGLSVYNLHADGIINNYNPDDPRKVLKHELDYQVGIFSATVSVLLDFSSRQPVVPYTGIGISIFAMKMEDFRDTGIGDAIFLRESNTSVGGHFELGSYVKISKRIWIDIRGRWHNGSGSIAVLEPDPPFNIDNYKVEQDVAQYTIGFMYFIR